MLFRSTILSTLITSHEVEFSLRGHLNFSDKMEFQDDFTTSLSKLVYPRLVICMAIIFTGSFLCAKHENLRHSSGHALARYRTTLQRARNFILDVVKGLLKSFLIPPGNLWRMESTGNRQIANAVSGPPVQCWLSLRGL